MSDSQNHGLSELGQRVQAMSDPAPEPRVRPQWEQFQGAPLPVGPPASGRLIPPYEAFEDLRVAPQPAPPPVPPSQPAQPSQFPATQFPATQPVSSAPVPPAPSHAPFAGPAPAYSAVSESPVMPPLGMPPAAAPGSSPAPPAPSTAPLANTAPEDPNAPKSGLQKAINTMRSALPFVQKLLPLLDGNFASVVGALMAPHPGHPPAPPQVRVDLEPIERGLSEVKTGQRELRVQIAEQTTSLKRVEDQLERVREATDRNTLEQQELVEDLRSVGNRVSTFAVIGLILLGISLLVNVYFLVQLQHILR